MSVEIEAHTAPPHPRRAPVTSTRCDGAIFVGLVNNMPDAEPDALIVTGTEPIAARLADEPYWRRLVELITWAEEHAVASIWSCLAAHAVVESIDGIQRRRLAEKRCGVFAHDILAGH